MKRQIYRKSLGGIPNGLGIKEVLSPSDIISTKIFQNKNNKQFNLAVLKRNTSPQIIKNILGNKDIIGLEFKITNVIFKKGIKRNDYP